MKERNTFCLQVRQAREMLVMARCQGLAPLQQVGYPSRRSPVWYDAGFPHVFTNWWMPHCNLVQVAMGRVASCIGEVS